MIDFKTKYSDRENGVVYTTIAGSPVLEEYEYQVVENRDGVVAKTLVKTDRVTNVYDRIQADTPATDINLLMKRFALGDTSALDVRQGMYFDATDMPKTYAEMFNRVTAATQVFEKLPVEVKELFNNSPEQFWSEYGNSTFTEKLDKYNARFDKASNSGYASSSIDEVSQSGDNVKEIDF